MLRVALAALHLLAFAGAFYGIFTRAFALRTPMSPGTLKRALVGDTHWGIAAAVLIATGLWRLLAGIEKATVYYTHDLFFMVKMGCLVLILLLEIGPMISLIEWRVALAKGASVDAIADPRMARRIGTISFIQASLMVLMVICATAMARGYGLMTVR